MDGRFSVWGPDIFDGTNREVLRMSYDDRCIPFDQLDSMDKAGYTFKIDGKKATKRQVIETFRNVPQHQTSTVKPKKSATVTSDPIVPPGSLTKILCIETGETFDRQVDAARRYSIDSAQVSDSIKTGRPRSGYTFKKVPVIQN